MVSVLYPNLYTNYKLGCYYNRCKCLMEMFKFGINNY